MVHCGPPDPPPSWSMGWSGWLSAGAEEMERKDVKESIELLEEVQMIERITGVETETV